MSKLDILPIGHTREDYDFGVKGGGFGPIRIGAHTARQ